MSFLTLRLPKKVYSRDDFIKILGHSPRTIEVHLQKTMYYPSAVSWGMGIALISYEGILSFDATFIAYTDEGQKVVLTESYYKCAGTHQAMNDPNYNLNFLITLEHRLRWLRCQIPELKVKVFDTEGSLYSEEILEQKQLAAASSGFRPWTV